ncbi:Gfo/Idh/MocA family protein [Microbacterium sp. GXS0129]|uniref:Gfo/Idh/MocA family protein n=1 Tax=Microbacterium sp. GXS0129 TaxID=3377836 RepID=UPI00383ACBA2
MSETTDQAPAALRAGFLGGGFMAAVHSRAARAARARLVALASSTPDRGVAAAAELGIERGVADVTEVAELSDIVHVCTPNRDHAAQTIALLAAGRHVICEKPLATTVSDALAVVDAADAAGVAGAVPFVYRYHPQVRHARELVRSGVVGTVLSVEGAYLQDWLLRETDSNWRVDSAAGGASRAFADIGSHLCDLLEFVTGRRIRAVSARTRTVFPERGGQPVTTEDLVAVVAELDNGALATLLVSQMAPGRKNGLTLEVHGTERSVRFAQERPEELWIGALTGSQLVLRDPEGPGDDGLSLVPAGHPMGYQDAFTAFVADAYAGVRGAASDALPTFRDGLRAARVTAAVLESALTRAWVSIPDVDEKETQHG